MYTPTYKSLLLKPCLKRPCSLGGQPQFRADNSKEILKLKILSEAEALYARGFRSQSVSGSKGFRFGVKTDGRSSIVPYGSQADSGLADISSLPQTADLRQVCISSW